MQPTTSYRSFLQAQANNGDNNALALLQVVGDDGRIDDTFTRSGTNVTAKGTNYTKDQINQLNQQYGQTYLNSGSGSVQGAYTETPSSGTAAGVDPEALRRIIDKSGLYLQQGLQGITDSYNKEVGNTKDKQAQATRDFETKRVDTTTGKNQALDSVDTNARTAFDSLRRILGLAGAGNSSAAQFAAPGAVSRQASQQRTGVINQFGTNMRNIDTAQGDSSLSFEKVLQDLLEQRNQKEQQLRTGIGDQEAQAYAGLGDTGKANQIQDSLDQLFSQFRTPIAPREANISTPTVNPYLVDRATINANNQPGATADNSPYAQLLRKRLQGGA